MSLKIICINAPPRSGKTTAANMLEDFFNESDPRCCVFPLADPIYQIIGTILFRGFNKDNKTTPIHELGDKTLREVAISIGETFKGLFGANVWVDRVISKITATYESKGLKQIGMKYEIFIVPDIGFQNELTAIVEEFGEENITLVKINRNGCNYDNDSRKEVKNKLDSEYLKHLMTNTSVVVSHKYNVKCYTIDNNGDLNDLRMRLEAVFKKDKERVSY